MKTLFLSLGALLLASCAHQQTLDSPYEGRAINFRSFVSRPDRGVDLEELSSVDFGLWAYQGASGAADGTNFATSSNAQLLKGGAGGFADAAQTVYWPAGDELMGFYAYAPYSAGTAHGITALAPTGVGAAVQAAPSFDFSVAPLATDQIDLLVARTEAQAPAASVPLTFRHALTKPVVVARTTAANWRVAITDVSFTNVAYRGSYTFPVRPADPNATNGWTVDAAQTTSYAAPLALNGTTAPNGTGAADAVVVTTDSYVPVSSTAEGNSMFLLPQTLGQEVEMVVRYALYNAASGAEITGLQNARVEIGGDTWKPGNVVTYRLSFDAKPAGLPGSEITFTTSVAGWDQTLAGTTTP